MKRKQKVLLAVSGGIDSSTSAYILKSQGYELEGIYLDLWRGFADEDAQKDISSQTLDRLDKLSKKYDFPISILDVKDKFYQTIVQYFINSLEQGLTPNPCVVCNRHMKFKVLFEELLKRDADLIATGHYARVNRTRRGTYQLKKGLDPSKDQSYYLCLLNQEVLSRIIFPLGKSIKKDVEKVYQTEVAPYSRISESQDLCFLAGKDYRTFLCQYAPNSLCEGNIVDTQGNKIGTHQGLAYYTIGQRKGLNIQASTPHFVIAKDREKNELMVGGASALGHRQFEAFNVNWIEGLEIDGKKRYNVKIRYRAKPVQAVVQSTGDSRISIKTFKELRDITPGQYAVLYHRDKVIAGGEISL